MAIQSASATLTSTTALEPIIGFQNYTQGVLDASGSIKATGRGTWSSLTSWDTMTSYIQTFDLIKWTSPLIDIGAIKSFNLDITTDYVGTNIDFLIHVSNTGFFAGEESEYLIEEGDLNVSSFYGRYCYVTARVTGTELRRLTVTTNTETITIEYPNVDTSTLSGTSTLRTLNITENVSGIVDVFIQAKAASSYAVNLYVSDTATSEVVIPVVKNKSTNLQFALYGIDNDARDSTVDILIKALPRQAMIGGNLRTIT